MRPRASPLPTVYLVLSTERERERGGQTDRERIDRQTLREDRRRNGGQTERGGIQSVKSTNAPDDNQRVFRFTTLSVVMALERSPDTNRARHRVYTRQLNRGAAGPLLGGI